MHLIIGKKKYLKLRDILKKNNFFRNLGCLVIRFI